MTALVLVADGAAGAFAAASTPHLDDITHTSWLQTVPVGLPVTSEVALPSLLGHAVVHTPARGAVEAAAVGRRLGPSEAAWRLDVPGLATAPPTTLREAASCLAGVVGGDVVHLRRGRFLVVGRDEWLDDTTSRDLVATLQVELGQDVALWGGGSDPRWPRLTRSTVVIAAPTGAAAGVARLLGADLVSPPGATGFPGSNLVAKARAARDLVEAGTHRLVVVHVGAVDEAGHARDRRRQLEAVMVFDRDVVGPLLAVAHACSALLLVTADHGTDPETGRHVGGRVPAWSTVPVPTGPATHAVTSLLDRPSGQCATTGA